MPSLVESLIPCMDLKKQYLIIKDEIQSAIERVCEKTAFSNGPFAKEFEDSFSRYCDATFCSTVNSGTSALHLALKALDIKEGDEVIVPADTFIATAWAVSYVNAVPVFVDCLKDTWNIDHNSLEKSITKKTRAIIGVHLYGQPFDIDPVKDIANKHGLYLIEDAAQAHGAIYKNKKIGGFGDMSCFSFYPGKNLGAYGEGGAIVTNNEDYYTRINRLRNHGSTERYYHEELGYNMRMDGIQAAVLTVKLKYIDAWTKRRQQIASLYKQGINNPSITFQHTPSYCDPVYHLFVITTPNRQEFMDFLKENNIHCGLHYPVPCHLQQAYSYLGYKKGDLPNTEFLSEHCVSLPMYPELTDEEVYRVIDIINNYS